MTEHTPTNEREDNAEHGIASLGSSLQHGPDGLAADQAGFCGVGGIDLHRDGGVSGDGGSGGPVARLQEQRRTPNGVEHTPEAQAAYPETEWTTHVTVSALREAFDRGRASMVETVTTEAEVEALPSNAVLLAANGLVFERASWAKAWPWRTTNTHKVFAHDQIALPARVLFRPSPEEGDQ